MDGERTATPLLGGSRPISSSAPEARLESGAAAGALEYAEAAAALHAANERPFQLAMEAESAF
jgi:hypothetical protein